MPGKIYLHLLILCGIWSQGIFGISTDEETKESSDFLVRQKRVVSLVPGEDYPVPISSARYVVIIKHLMRIQCVGSILSKYVVITAASCVLYNPEQYQVIPNSATADRGYVANNVTEIRKHSNIALLIVIQPFVCSINCNYLQLHYGPLLPGIVGKVSGWGFNWRCAERGTNFPTKLRSIELPIIGHQDCVNRYRPQIKISEKEVCTLHPQRNCGHTDIGAGLVVDGYLAGVHLWTGLNASRIDPEYPEVFAILQHSYYSNWIKSNLQAIDLHRNSRA